jgi:hypothetical protein
MLNLNSKTIKTKSMKNIYKYLVTIILIGLLAIPVNNLLAGNKDRSGQAGAYELLINPWARSAGWGGVNISNTRGLESIYSNVAGLAFTKRTELVFSNTQWLQNSDIKISSFGFAQRVGETGVFAVAIMSLNLGDIEITQENLPEGGIGTYNPNFMNINIAYSKAFSSSIYAGINLKIISESISDISAQGVAIDAGIQYLTGERENIKFGITLKNVGRSLSFNGDGMSFRAIIPGDDHNKFTVEQRSANYELPTQLNIGAAYDFLFGDEHRFTIAGNFASNAFTKDQFIFGCEYSLKKYLLLRAGYTYEDGITEKKNRTTWFTGPSAGFSIQVPLNKEKGSLFSVDYSFRATDPYTGIHSIGARIDL